MSFEQAKLELHIWLEGIQSDPFSKILLEKSSFTRIQLETLLINALGKEIAGFKLSFKEKAALRRKKGVSKGAFNRTLRQAESKVRRSIATVLLLGYLGLLETPDLEVFHEASHKLNEYRHNYIERTDSLAMPTNDASASIVLALEKELREAFGAPRNSRKTQK